MCLILWNRTRCECVYIRTIRYWFMSRLQPPIIKSLICLLRHVMLDMLMHVYTVYRHHGFYIKSSIVSTQPYGWIIDWYRRWDFDPGVCDLLCSLGIKHSKLHHLIVLTPKDMWRKHSMLQRELPRFRDQFLPKSADSTFNDFSSGGFEKLLVHGIEIRLPWRHFQLKVLVLNDFSSRGFEEASGTVHEIKIRLPWRHFQLKVSVPKQSAHICYNGQ